MIPMYSNKASNIVPFYLFYSTSVVFFGISILVYSSGIMVFSLVLLLIASIYFNSGHLLNNLLIRRSAIVEIINGYSLGPDLKSIVKKSSDEYEGLAAAVVKQKADSIFNEAAFSRVVENFSDNFEFSIRLREVDKRRITEELETKKKMKEIAISRTAVAKDSKLGAQKKELELINNELQNISGSKKALEVDMRIRTFSHSADDVDAGIKAYKELEKLISIVSSTTNLECEILSGERLLLEEGYR